MIENDMIRFAEIFTGLAEVFNEQLSKVRLKLYFEAFQDLSLSEFENAVNRVVRENKFFPKPSEIRELVRGKKGDSALQAWIAVTGAVREHDYYTTVTFEDRIINAALCAGWGDWAKFCNDMGERGKEWVQKDFERLYNLYCERRPVDPPDRVIGWHDKTNIGKGYKAQEPVLIGGWQEKKVIEDGRTRVQIEGGEK